LKGLADAPILESLGIDVSARAETVTIEAYVLLANRLDEHARES
jgi:16S rRNA A1518/A1519 N6-dimethyltransferase RsmA/KsgA/DIM1 with predicted DNA glycosylase/AP lyase activity